MQIASRRTHKAQLIINGLWIVIFLHSSFYFSSGSPQLSIPTIGVDQLIYACANKEVLAFRGNGTLAWRIGMNQTCQTGVTPVLDYDGKVYVAADRTVVVVTPPASEATQPSAADFFSMVPAMSLKAIGKFSSITGLAVTSWSSVLYINTGTGIHAFMLDGTPLWSTLVQFSDSVMKSPESMGPCSQNMTNCTLLPWVAVDQCDGSIYVARTDGWLFSYATWQPFMRWRYTLSIDVPLSVKIITGSNGRIYAAMAKYDTVYALSTELGNLIWQAKVGPLSEASGIPVVDLLGFVSISSLDGFLYVISPDGTYINKYLAADNTARVSIQVSPVLDCSKEALFVAQTKVKAKTILEKTDGTKTLSFTQYLGMILYMIVPSSGQILWNTVYPDLSSRSFCKTEQNLHKLSCSQFLFRVTRVQHPGNNRPIIAFSVSLFVIFLLLSLLSILIYCLWKKKQTVHRHRLRRFLKQKRFRHPQGLLLKRQRVYKQTIKHLQGELELQPRSSKVLEQLKKSLEGLHLVDRYLAMFPSDTLLDDHLHQERLLVEDASACPDSKSATLRHGFWTVLIDRAFHTLLGVPEDEDFIEEMHLLSLYDDIPPDPPLTFTPQQITPQVHKQNSSLRRSSVGMQASQDQLNKQVSSAVLDASSMEEYSNPLYDRSPTATIVSSTKKTVSFSPVKEIFKGVHEYSSSASNDSIVGSKQKSAEFFASSGDIASGEIEEDDMSWSSQDQAG